MRSCEEIHSHQQMQRLTTANKRGRATKKKKPQWCWRKRKRKRRKNTQTSTPAFMNAFYRNSTKTETKKKSLSEKVISDLWRPEPNPVEMPSTTATKHRQQKGNNETPVKPLSTRDDCSPSLKLLVTLLGWNRLTTGNRENTFNRRTATVETLLECLPSK